MEILKILISLFLIVGVSYAVWRLYLSQTNTSKLLSTCFQMELTDQDDINLENTYPITDRCDFPIRDMTSSEKV